VKNVRAKKGLGQHFLTDEGIAMDIVAAFNREKKIKKCLEVGAGMGVLTKHLNKRSDLDLFVIDIDTESIEYLKNQEWIDQEKLIEGDFLATDLGRLFEGEQFGIIGNFPYNISSQILFKALDYKDQAIEIVGMFQKEVAERIASKEGSKVYGITSVLLQAFYEIEYLFTVDEHVFNPPPKVKSAVIRLTRNSEKRLNCDEKLFKSIVKMAFNQRRKTMRNSLKPILREEIKDIGIFNLRPEQLSVTEFVELTNLIRVNQK